MLQVVRGDMARMVRMVSESLTLRKQQCTPVCLKYYCVCSNREYHLGLHQNADFDRVGLGLSLRTCILNWVVGSSQSVGC